MSEKLVFHGTPKVFDSETANPRQNIRINTEGKVIFDEESFHATPHKWIALAYTYSPKAIPSLGENVYYSMGVNLDSDEKEIAIYGVVSLEDSLAHMYKEGGYVYHFDNGDFVYKEGLGSQEVVASSPTKPLHMEKVDDPVKAMQDLGVKFHFVDLAQQRSDTI